MERKKFTQNDIESIVKGNLPRNTALLKPKDSLSQGDFNCSLCHEKAKFFDKLADIIRYRNGMITILPTVTAVCTKCFHLDFFMDVPEAEFLKF